MLGSIENNISDVQKQRTILTFGNYVITVEKRKEKEGRR